MPIESPATIHIVDDDDAVRTAIGRMLRALGYAVQSYASASEFLSDTAEKSRGCILLDVQMPGLSGTELQERLSQRGSGLPIVFLTGHGDIPMSVRAIKAGAEDFLAKPVSKEVLVEAIERALKRCEGSVERTRRLNGQRARLDRLTPREREVFDRVVKGKLNKQIAFELGTSERTIKAHRHNIMEKMQVRSVAELVSIAEHLGVLREEKGEAS